MAFSREKMRECPSTLPPEWEAIHFCCSKSPCFGHFEVNTALSVFSPLLPALGHSIFPWCTVLLLSRMLLVCSYLCARGGGAHQSTNCGLPLCKNHKTGCWERQSHASSYIYIYIYIYIIYLFIYFWLHQVLLVAVASLLWHAVLVAPWYAGC